MTFPSLFAESHSSRPKHPIHSLRQTKSDGFIITIYAEGEDRIEAAKKEFIEQCRKSFDTKNIAQNICAILDDLNEDQVCNEV